MKLLSTVGALSLILLVAVCLSCGGSGDTTQPAAGEEPSAGSVDAAVDEAVDAVDEAVDQATDEAVAEAGSAMGKIKAEIAAKEADLAKIADELKALSPQDMMGEKGSELKAKSEALTEEIDQLKAKLDSMM